MEAGNGIINLTVMGCKKIPSSAFKHFTMLKSITLPDVEEIGEYAFANCTWLQKVVLGNLKKVYGNKDSGGIFDGCDPKHYIDLVLSNDQKVMRGKEIEDGGIAGLLTWKIIIIPCTIKAKNFLTMISNP